MKMFRAAFRALGAAALLTGFFAGAAPSAALAHVLVGYGLSSFGDLKYPPDFPHFDHVNPEAPKGGQMRTTPQSALNAFDSLNPFILQGDPAEGAGTLPFDSLMVSGGDEPDAVYGLVAEHAEYVPGKWVTFQLRPEARFSDGTPVTAEDVKFSFDILREKGSPRLKPQLEGIASVEVLTPLRVHYVFAEGVPTRDLPLVAAGLPIFSKASWEGRDFAKSSLDPILGSGPYVVESTAAGRRIVWKRREDYWAKDLPVNKGRWNFDRIVFEYFADSTAGRQALFSGELDLREEMSANDWATAYDAPPVRDGRVIREAIPDGRPAGTQGYWLNMRRPHLADPRVREALDLAFDFEWSNRTLFSGLYQRTTSFFQNSGLEARGLPTPGELALLEPFRDQLPAAVFDEPAYVPPVTDGSGRNREAMLRAGQLLDAAGWKVVKGKRVNAAGEPLKIEFLEDNPAFARITNPYLRNLGQLGIEATLRQIDSPQMQLRLKSYDYDIVTGRFVMAPTPGVEMNVFFSSESAAQDGGYNLSGLSSPAVDALVEAVAEAPTREANAEAVRALDRVLRAEHIWVPHWNKASHTLAWWDRYGRPETKPPYDRGVLSTWWARPAP
ncbi:extracellular solute-binding protein [Neomegalonema sp.]|uniref:extracellular solute-binding protein n=1 Tax=Neomegalonema sp. TaxID=2039713 RepID=UPI00261730DE|nr:extracellular solute-binding protein [Neomegalonema sp.]MDD2868004.1 extracellular solute-binding protein [Neomegalonema sp.]